MYIFKDLPEHKQENQWIDRSLRIGDCFDVLLHNKRELCPEAFEIIRKHGIPLEEDIYVLVQFEGDTLWTAELLLNQRSHPLLGRIIEIWGSMFSMHLFTSDGCLYALLVFAGEFQREQFIQDVKECCKKLMDTEEGQSLRFLISQEERGTQGIFHSANSLRYGRDYLQFFEDPDRVCFLDLRKQTMLGDGNEMPVYRRLATSLGERLGDENFQPETAAQEVLDTLRGNSSCSIEALHGQMQSFSLMFLNHILGQGLVDEDFIKTQQISYRIMEGDRASRYVENLTQTLKLLRQRHLELREKYNMEHLNRVRTYTEQNISSMELSVSQIAEYFGVNRSILTAQFREYFGQSLAEYIHTTRLDRARLLIESHPTRSIEQIAQEAGYCSLSTMYRAFQKAGLCSPARYRQLINGGQQEPIAL